MSISHSLSNALSGMTASSRLAEIVSSNIANALTEGYGRRSLNLSSAVVGGRGAGVEIGSVTRHIDRGILADRRLADASLGASDALVTALGRMQDLVGSSGVEGSISSHIVNLEAALIDAASDPSSATGLAVLGDRFRDLANSLNAASDGLQTMRVEADQSIAAQVETLNTALQNLERLNKDISTATYTGVDPSGLMDQRQQVIDQIAEIVPVRELDRDHNQIALMTPSGELLIDGPAKEFGFVPNLVITPDMTLSGGGLTGLTLDGVPVAANGIGKLDGGTLGAAFQARDTELPTAQSELDQIAYDLISRFEDPSMDTTLAPGQAGLLTDNGVALNPANLAGLAGRIQVNAAIDPSQGGFVTALRDGLGALGPGPTGDASLLQRMSSALSDPRPTSGDPVAMSAAGRAASVEASLGNRRLTLESDLSFATARWTSLKEAEAANGVDTDYEMQMLLRVEQAYAANARVMETINSMMQSLMEI